MKHYLSMERGKLLVSVLFVSLFVAGCHNSGMDTPQPAAQSEPVAFRNGAISFATGEDFTNFIEKEFQKPFNEYQQDLRTIVPATARARMSAENDDDDVVKDPYFAALLNADRETSIGGTVYRMTHVGTFSFKEEKRAQALEAIRKIEANGGKLSNSRGSREATGDYNEFIPIDGDVGWYPPIDPEVTAPPTDLDPVMENITVAGDGCGRTSNTKTKQYFGDFGGFADNLKEWNALKRGKDLKAVVWSENWGVFSSAGIKTVNQQKHWSGIWFRNNADFISWQITSGTLEFKDAFGVPFSVDLTGDDPRNNDSMAFERFDWNSAKFKLSPLPIPTSLAKTYKIKNIRSCHFIRDDGTLTAEVKLAIN